MDTNNLIWNSLKDGTVGLEFVLSSIALFVLMFFNYLLRNENITQDYRYGRLVTLLITAAYISLWVSSLIPSLFEYGDESIEASDYRYEIGTGFLGLAILLFALVFYLGTTKFYKSGDLPGRIDTSYIFYYTLFFSLLAFTGYTVVYIIYEIYKGDDFFPLTSDNYLTVKFGKINHVLLTTSLIIPVIIFFFSLVCYFLNKYNNDRAIDIPLGISAVLGLFLIIATSLCFGLDLSQEAKFITLYSAIGLSITALIFAILYKNETRDISSLILFSTGLLLAFGLLVGLVYAAYENSLPKDKEYTIYLVSSTLFIIFSIIASLGFLIFSKARIEFSELNNRDFSFFHYIYLFFFVINLIGFALSLYNIINVSGQKIKNQSALDGTNFENHDEKDYELMNLAMFFGYLTTFLIGFSIGFYMILNYRSKIDNDLGKILVDFLMLKGNSKGNLFNLFSLVFYASFTTVLYYFIAHFGNEENFKLWNSKDIEKSLILPAFVLVVIYLLETFISYASGSKEESFFLLVYRFFSVTIFYLLPITSLILYLVINPKFFRKLDNTKTTSLIFANTKDNNALPVTNLEEGQHSIFSVDSNFSAYGNGLILSGGESNLDIEAIRGIRYVSNQSDYFNFKYLNSEVDSFDTITRENSVNIFTLAMNDLSFGRKRAASNAYWVAVGENVGLTDSVNNTIFYNTDAGADSLQTIPKIETIDDWKAGSGTFEFKGNGVASGSTGGNNIWVAVGQDKIDYASAGEAYNTIKHSTDGINWSNASGVSFSSYGSKVAFSPAGLGISGGTAVDTFVAVGYDYIDDNHIVYSTDGQNWTAATGATFSDRGNDVAYGLSSNGTSGIWVAVGVDDTRPIKYSVDGGVSWKNADGVSFSLQEGGLAVIYNLNTQRFEAVGKKNKDTNSSILYHSTNGKNWSPDTTLVSDLVEATSLVYNAGLKGNNTSGDNYDSILYPEYDYNKFFFVNKKSNLALNLFNYIFYGSLIFLLLLFFLTLNVLSKDKSVNERFDKFFNPASNTTAGAIARVAASGSARARTSVGNARTSVGNARTSVGNAAARTRTAVGNAAARTRTAVGNAAARTRTAVGNATGTGARTATGNATGNATGTGARNATGNATGNTSPVPSGGFSP